MSRIRSRVVAEVAAAPRRRWRSAEAKAVLDRVDASGLTVREFARREGLSVERLLRWRRALAGNGASAPAFVELALPGAASAGVEIVFRSGSILRVPSSFDEQTVRRLVELLEGRPAPC